MEDAKGNKGYRGECFIRLSSSEKPARSLSELLASRDSLPPVFCSVFNTLFKREPHELVFVLPMKAAVPFPRGGLSPPATEDYGELTSS